MIKVITNQDANYKWVPVKSGETSINLSQEIATFIAPDVEAGGQRRISFIVHKEDYLKALGFIANILPLYISSSNSSVEKTYSNVFFKDTLNTINGFFGDENEKAYSTNYFSRNDGRFYLNDLNNNGFNIRDFFVSYYSVLFISKNGDTLDIRLTTGPLKGNVDKMSKEERTEAFFEYIDKTKNGLTRNNYKKATENTQTEGKPIQDNIQAMGFPGTLLDITDLAIITTLYKNVCADPNNAIWNQTCSATIGCYRDFILSMYENPKIKGPIDTNNKKLPLQQIYYGAPGTGKSHAINEQTKDERVIRTTFHPDSDYSTFVGCYKPTMEEADVNVIPVVTVNGIRLDGAGSFKEKRISYKFVKQAFLKAYLGAWKLYSDANGVNAKPQYLIIEEINRGNCAQIFGDLFQLLDRGDNDFSEYPIEADTDLQKEIQKAFSEEDDYKLTNDLSVENAVENYTSNYNSTLSKDIQAGRVLLLPPNLYIWATMNTSDQSLFPIDSAFKRRWNWVYMPIDTAKENWSIRIGNKYYSWTAFLNKVNKELLTVETAEDKHLGFYFCKASEKKNEDDIKPTIITQEAFVAKVLFYLWTDVFKVYGIPSAIGSSKDWAFADFYNSNGSVNIDKVKELMDKLNIGSLSEGDVIDVEVMENSAEAQNSVKNKLKAIKFPDGEVFEKNGNTFDTYIKAIEKIGVDKIATVADRVKFQRSNRPLISTEKYPELDNKDGFSYYQIGDYYFVKGTKTLTYVRILETLNDLLNLGMEIVCGE